ncbi:hypothetical protein M3Y94_00584900 [Aphelenchoides besseyi]|nr:hypothetical protein M3Y94_00584900 [Aphelenchoides besseyi]KAI6222069.1 hypothetical protein M3Y95_00945400 [Aphelenchoides besseyi]
MNKLLFVTVVAAFGLMVNAQMVPQCTCSAVQPCKSSYVDSILPCADSCQQHAAAIGANYQKLRSCLLQKEGAIRSTLQCTEGKLANSCAAGPGKMVQKRYPETLKIAAMSEINRMLSRSGVSGQVQSLLAHGKKFVSCMRSCMDRKSGNCAKKLGCGLDLPSDTVMVQNAKSCAIASGFNTPGVQQLCQCAASAGIAQLASICPRLQVS